MGELLFDKYSALHFLSGYVAYHFYVPLIIWIIIHIIFEILENTNTGMYIITNYIKIWPGGKKLRILLLIVLETRFSRF